MKVFIVDDSLMIWARIIEMLSEIDGIDVVGFSGRKEDAIKRIRQLNPDVVILDIKLYGGSGIEVLRSIKQDRPETIVAMFSNYPYPEYKEKCMELGADYFFDKSKEFNLIPDFLVERLG